MKIIHESYPHPYVHEPFGWIQPVAEPSWQIQFMIHKKWIAWLPGPPNPKDRRRSLGHHSLHGTNEKAMLLVTVSVSLYLSAIKGSGGSIDSSSSSERLMRKAEHDMNNFFLPISRKKNSHFSNILPSWGPNCPDYSSFCPLSSSGQKKGSFGVGLGVFCVCTYLQKGLGVCDGWVKIRGWWWYSGQNKTPYGQNESHLDNLYKKWEKVLQNWEKKIQSWTWSQHDWLQNMRCSSVLRKGNTSSWSRIAFRKCSA